MTQLPLAFAAPKLGRLAAAVQSVMSDGRWYTMRELEQAVFEATAIMATATGLSARVRELRKLGFRVEAKVRTGKLWQYRISK